MKIIILAAGIGSRLKPLTENTPKSLLYIDNNVTALERTIKMINRNCKADIVIVTGYYRKKVEECVSKFPNCKTINNPFYRITNSIASLWFAKEELNDDTIIINGDIILEENLFKHILTINYPAFVLYDSSIGNEADYKVAERDGNVIVMSKELNCFSGEYVGVTCLHKSESEKILCKVEKMVDDGLFNEWYETALVNMIFNDMFNLKAIDVCNYRWTEIDNVNDLIKAKEIISYEKLQ